MTPSPDWIDWYDRYFSPKARPKPVRGGADLEQVRGLDTTEWLQADPEAQTAELERLAKLEPEP